MSSNHIVLRPAYTYDCEECGRENFVRGLMPEFSGEELEDLRAEHGIEPWQAGAFVQMPSSVICGHCGTEFSTVHIKDS